MAESFSFLRQNRSDIGLVDRYDLSEIYDSDERIALSNLLLDPDGLDQIDGLAKSGLIKEDIRTMGDLDKSVVQSIGISQVTLSNVSFSLSQQITTDKAIGEPGKHSFSAADYSDNVLIVHGGIAAKKIEYNFLDTEGNLRTTTVPTSRESLFNSAKNVAGEYTSASYPGTFRIRRRSHIHELRLARQLLTEKTTIIESPSDTLKIPVYMRTASNNNPAVVNLQCYATKNSPLILPVRIFNSATISFGRNISSAASPAFVYGWELRRKSDLLLVRSGTVQSAGDIKTVPITISTAGTVCNGVDSLLYVYLDPSAVNTAVLSGIGMTEISGKDIGLIGFDQLQDLDISSNGLSTIPVWLKTLHGTLKRLNIRDNAFWNNGIVSFFDWQEPPTGVTGASNGGGKPNVTLAQVLGYSGYTNSGAITNYDGTFGTVMDSAGSLYKDQRNVSINGGTAPVANIENGFRPFTLLEELNLGPTIRLANPDFSTLFPNLKVLSVDTGGYSPRVYYGLIPKLRNNGATMSLNATQHYGDTGGSIRYLGDNITWNTADTTAQKQQFIGQFKFVNFNIDNGSGGAGGWFGGICTTDAELGTSIPAETVDGLSKYSFVASGTASEAWSGWLTSMQSLNIYFRDIAFRIADAESLNWQKLDNVNNIHCGIVGAANKVKYNPSVGIGTMSSTDIVKAPLLKTLNSWAAGWYGKLFSIKSAPALSYGMLGYNNWEGYQTSNGTQYILPDNFVDPSTSSSYHGLQQLFLHYILNASSKDLEFRPNDLENLPRLSVFYLEYSYFVGKFPTIYTAANSQDVPLYTWFGGCRFRDISALGSANTSRVAQIYGPMNSADVGGCLIPSFKTLSTNSRLGYINLQNSLSQRYPYNWATVADRGKLIHPLVVGTVEENTPGVLWTSKNNNGTVNQLSEKLFQSNVGGFAINSEVMVGDVVFQGAVEIGRVTQIDRNNAFIYIDTEVSVTNATLKFRRKGQDISEFFDNHIGLGEVYLHSSRLTGKVPLFANCGSLRLLYLNNNLLTEYQLGTLKNITGMSVGNASTPALSRFFLEGNPLTKESIRKIISDVHDIAVYFKSKNVRPNFIVGLYSTKYNSANKEYQNWAKTEVFDQVSTTVNAAGETVTIPDPLETKFNQLGAGALYSTISIQIF